MLIAAYWRTNLTPRQLAPLFGVSKSAADRVIDHLGPSLALRPRKRFRKDTVLIMEGTLVPTRDHTIAEQSKNYRYSTNHQVVIDADTRLVVAVGRPLPGNRNDCKAWGLTRVHDSGKGFPRSGSIESLEVGHLQRNSSIGAVYRDPLPVIGNEEHHMHTSLQAPRYDGLCMRYRHV